jgi:ABC-type polysaccharide/polyol phosphate export permease
LKRTAGFVSIGVNSIKSEATTMKKQLVRISVLQSSKIVTALYVLMGFLYTLAGIPLIVFGNGQLRIIGIIYIFGPVFAGILGFIFFVIFAALYNALVKIFGGFEVEVQDVPGPS